MLMQSSSPFFINIILTILLIILFPSQSSSVQHDSWLTTLWNSSLFSSDTNCSGVESSSSFSEGSTVWKVGRPGLSHSSFLLWEQVGMCGDDDDDNQTWCDKGLTLMLMMLMMTMMMMMMTIIDAEDDDDDDHDDNHWCWRWWWLWLSMIII